MLCPRNQSMKQRRRGMVQLFLMLWQLSLLRFSQMWK
uniref:Uncharacterized protein n=1 Tax=Picea sitchensis TaxID=3332 RepID=A9NM46_PICSI|nr:unknown [Picea sitchensis]